MGVGQCGEVLEIGRGVAFGGGDAHQAGQGRAEAGTHGADEGVGLSGGDAGFLRFVADIDLDQQGWRGAGGLHGVGDGVGEFRAVQGFDAMGEPDRRERLVGLQPADEVEFGFGVGGEQSGEFPFGFLDTVFAEPELAGGDGFGDGGGGLRFGNRDERDLIRIAAGAAGGLRDAGADMLQGVFYHMKNTLILFWRVLFWRAAASEAGAGGVGAGMDEGLLAWGRAVKQRRRAKLPVIWLFTDAMRLPDPLPAIAQLPCGLCGVVFRHDGAPERAALALRVAALCRRRGLALVVAGDTRLAMRVGAGFHLRGGRWPDAVRPNASKFPVTASAHDMPEIRRARLAGAKIVFLSPVFATASHPGKAALGPLKWVNIARRFKGLELYCLGGVNGKNIRLLGKDCAGAGAITVLFP